MTEQTQTITETPPPQAAGLPNEPKTKEPTRSRDDGPTWWRWTRRAFAAVLLLAMVASWLDGWIQFLLVFGPSAVLVATVVQRLVAWRRGRLVTGIGRHLFAKENRPYLVQMHIRGPLAMLATYMAIVAAPRASQSQYLLSVALVAVPALLFAQLQLFPARPVSRSLNVVAVIAAVFLAFQLVTIHFRSGLDDAVSIAAPFETGEWTVIAGGRSTLISHHYGPATPQQRYAVDLLMVDDGRTRDGDADADDLASYHAWDQVIVAPADGTVVDVENDLRDHPIGSRETEPERAKGNFVTIDIGEDRFVTMAHLRQGSVTVAEGDLVAEGQVIARVGNSGNTTEPHLHLQIQDVADVPSELFAGGVETFPIHMTDITHIRGGTEHDDQTSQLRRNDIIRVDDPATQTTQTTQTTTESESESEQS